MAVRLMANGSPISNTELAVFAGEECRSAATTNAEGIVFLTIPGDEACELTFKVAIGNEVVDAPHTLLTYETDAIFGTPAKPLTIDLGSITGIWEILNGTGIETIYDLSGRKMDHRKMQKGVYIINGQKKAVK